MNAGILLHVTEFTLIAVLMTKSVLSPLLPILPLLAMSRRGLLLQKRSQTFGTTMNEPKLLSVVIYDPSRAADEPPQVPYQVLLIELLPPTGWCPSPSVRYTFTRWGNTLARYTIPAKCAPSDKKRIFDVITYPLSISTKPLRPPRPPTPDELSHHLVPMYYGRGKKSVI